MITALHVFTLRHWISEQLHRQFFQIQSNYVKNNVHKNKHFFKKKNVIYALDFKQWNPYKLCNYFNIHFNMASAWENNYIFSISYYFI